jgi:phosphohistidine phosphatase SixA
VAILRGDQVNRILSSPTARCHQTVIPLSQHRGVPIELATSLDVHAPVERLLELVVDPSMQRAVLCGHGEQMRGLLQLLIGSVSVEGPLRLAKGSVWKLAASGDKTDAAHYVPPLRLTSLADLHRLRSAEAV